MCIRDSYITIGETSFKKQGIATKAGTLVALYGFEVLQLNKIYAYIEFDNPSLHLDLKRGFHVEGFLRKMCIRDRLYL